MEDRKVYTIELLGCDDYTSFEMALKKEEVELIIDMCKMSRLKSTYTCMPTMAIIDNKQMEMDI